MSSEVLLSNIIPFAGSGIVGYRLCFEKDLEVDSNYCRLLDRNILFGVQLLQKYGYVSSVNWDYLP